jgi:hypothetical protein
MLSLQTEVIILRKRCGSKAVKGSCAQQARICNRTIMYRQEDKALKKKDETIGRLRSGNGARHRKSFVLNGKICVHQHTMNTSSAPPLPIIHITGPNAMEHHILTGAPSIGCTRNPNLLQRNRLNRNAPHPHMCVDSILTDTAPPSRIELRSNLSLRCYIKAIFGSKCYRNDVLAWATQSNHSYYLSQHSYYRCKQHNQLLPFPQDSFRAVAEIFGNAQGWTK